jgi:hypothetical protein
MHIPAACCLTMLARSLWMAASTCSSLTAVAPMIDEYCGEGRGLALHRHRQHTYTYLLEDGRIRVAVYVAHLVLISDHIRCHAAHVLAQLLSAQLHLGRVLLDVRHV